MFFFEKKNQKSFDIWACRSLVTGSKSAADAAEPNTSNCRTP
jgi:hypothetical protein